jgi:hypothetical protein
MFDLLIIIKSIKILVDQYDINIKLLKFNLELKDLFLQILKNNPAF